MKIKHYLQTFNEKIKHFFRNYGMIFAVLLSFLAVGLGAYNTYILKIGLVKGNLADTKKVDKMTVSEIEKIINAGAPVLGNKDAKVTVVEFADFQCPYCEKYFKDILTPLKQKYIDTGKVRFVYLSFAFLGEESVLASLASKCASDQGQFWSYHDYLYNNQQGSKNSGAFSTDNLKKFAAELKLNTSNFNECLDTRKYQKALDAEKALASRFGVTGTPATFINDFYISGLQGLSYFENRIDTALQGK